MLRVGGSIFSVPAMPPPEVRLLQGQRVVVEQRIAFIDYSGVEMLHQEAHRLLGLGRSLTRGHGRQWWKN